MTKYSNYKDYYLRNQIKNKQEKMLLLKSFLLNQKNTKKIRFKIMLKLIKTYHSLVGNKIKNRCVFSTKVRYVSRVTNLTKASFRTALQ